MNSNMFSVSPEVFRMVDGIQRVSPKRGLMRYILKINKQIGCVFKNSINAGTRPSAASFDYTMSIAFPRKLTRWRIDYWRPYSQRPHKGLTLKYDHVTPTSIMTINVCGLKNKMLRLEHLLKTHKTAVCAIQETLHNEGHYQKCPEGYRAICRPQTDAFRGQTILVHKSLAVYELGEFSRFCIHIKVSRLTGIPQPVHILSVYLLSGGNHRRGRRLQIEAIGRRYNKITRLDRDAKVMVLGDFNCESETLEKHLVKITSGLEIRKPKGSAFSRFLHDGNPTAIDHILVNNRMLAHLRRPRVERGQALSDHAPVVAHLRKELNTLKPPPVYRFNSDTLKEKGEELILHNRFAVLASVQPLTPEDLDAYTEKFISTTDEVAKKLGLKTPKMIGEPKIPRKLKVQLKKIHHKRRLYHKAKPDTTTRTLLYDKIQRLEQEYHKAHGKWTERQKAKWRHRVAGPLMRGDGKKIWTNIKNLAETTGSSSDGITPLRDHNNQLKTTHKEILEVAKNHYKKLAAEDIGHSKDKEYWEKIPMPPITKPPEVRNRVVDLMDWTPEPDIPIPALNNPIAWTDVLMAIRVMNRGTAAGPDEIHVDVLKELLKLECKMEVQRVMNEEQKAKNLRPRKAPEGIYFALREDQLPKFPGSPMGKALFTIITTMWALEVTPKAWDSVDIINLFKAGDPEYMTNYRGISLIRVGLKIMLTILQARILKGLEERGLLVKWQAGYRQGEEAIAHYIALSEIVRRRVIDGKVTMGVFIDFQKAFDKVPHEGLWRLLESKGINGKALNLIKWIYEHSQMSIRMGGLQSESFSMLRGTRQGCPLSPLLFIIYVNSMLEDCPSAGLTDMREYSGLDRIAGQQYADDLLGLLMDETKLQSFLDELDEWCSKWEAAINGRKLGIMLWSTGKGENLSKTAYYCGSEQIPVVDKYKYVGIHTYEYLGWDNGQNEDKHAEALCIKGWNSLQAMIPMLRMRNLPIGYKVHAIRGMLIGIMSYGGEWLGMKAKYSAKLQSVVNQALRIAMGRSAHCKDIDMFTLAYELNVPPMAATMAQQRARLLDKAENGAMRVALANLVRQSRAISSRKRTWSTGTRCWLKGETTKLQKRIAEFNDTTERNDAGRQLRGKPPFRDWVGLGQSFESHNRVNAYRHKTIEDIDAIILNLDKKIQDHEYLLRRYLMEERWNWTEEQWYEDRERRIDLTGKRGESEDNPELLLVALKFTIVLCLPTN